MLHLMKLAVGIRGVAHLADVQAARLETGPPLRHQTRHRPKRAEEIIGVGSMYWVIAGTMLVRQRVLDIVEESRDDGTRCAGLVLDPALVTVDPRPVKVFQGWRYLQAPDAPADLVEGEGGPDAMPMALRQELRALCLL